MEVGAYVCNVCTANVTLGPNVAISNNARYTNITPSICRTLLTVNNITEIRTKATEVNTKQVNLLQGTEQHNHKCTTPF